MMSERGDIQFGASAPTSERDEKLIKVRALMKLRESRRALFGPRLFIDPDWEIMLRLFAAELDGSSTRTADLLSSITTVPTSTLLRFLRVLEDDAHLVRTETGHDEVLQLTEDSLLAMHAMFEILPGQRLL